MCHVANYKPHVHEQHNIHRWCWSSNYLNTSI